MTREQAAARVAKLQALAEPGRGGSPAERALATKKAGELTARFGLHKTPRPTPPRSVPPFGQRGPRRGPPRRSSGRVFVTDLQGAAWAFNAVTGEHSDNVKVRSYRNRSNWKIEVEL